MKQEEHPHYYKIDYTYSILNLKIEPNKDKRIKQLQKDTNHNKKQK